MNDVVSRATPALQVAAVVISYVTRMIEKLMSLFSFTTGITGVE